MSSKKRRVKKKFPKQARPKPMNSAQQNALYQQAMKAQQAGKLEQAASLYRKLLTARPDHVAARYLLGNLMKAQGKLKEATALYQQVIEQQPDYTQAHFTYAGVHKYQDAADPHIMAMLRLYRDTRLPDDKRIHLAFALGKAFDDIGDYAQAFRYLEVGNLIRYREFNYRIDGDAGMFANIMDTFTGAALAGLDVVAQESDRPIFIVGMPRSGTSLVEKILSSHTEVHAAGEIQDFYALGGQLFFNPARQYQFNALNSYAESAFRQLGDAYLEKLDAINPRARRVTDKLPFNFLMIGLIRAALPNARIIHCTRDARDNCLSIYKRNFTVANYRFAYDLKSLGQFHNLYRELMAHWHREFPGVIYDISYESLTQNPEAEIRDLLEACGLEWQEDCLQFHRSEGVVTTASAVQVRQPMYTSSVKLWEQYGDALAPLLQELDRGV